MFLEVIMTLREKIAIVTGGAHGIGRAIVKSFLEKGFSVIIADIDREAGEETAAEYAKYGPLLFIPADVSVEDDVIALVDGAVDNFGYLDVLVNNAGISRNMPVEKLSMEDWNLVIGVNLTGPFLCAKYASPHLMKRSGCIINIASTRAFMSERDTEAYSASKGGIVALTHSLALSLGPDVRVNCISPGWIETSALRKRGNSGPELTEADHLQHPAGRVGKPEDISSLVSFLASEEASFITGANFMVDGGMTKKMIYV